MGRTQTAASKEKFAAFDIQNITYQTVNGHAITADILIPKSMEPGKHPVIVSFHGGYLITGSSLFLAKFGNSLPWIMDFTLEHSAVLVRPNYRKLPESTGLEILENLCEFWRWLHRDLKQRVSSATANAVETDESKTLVMGHSAGAYLAVQSVITQPKGRIQAVIAGYGMLDLRSPWFTHAYEKHPLNRPMLPETLIDTHLAAIKPNTVISAIDPPARVDLAIATVQHGRFAEMLGDDTSVYPLEMLETVETFPPLFLYHGVEDTAVEVAQTEVFADKVKAVLPSTKLLVRLEHGDHGFDAKMGRETPGVKEGLDFVTAEWLR